MGILEAKAAQLRKELEETEAKIAAGISPLEQEFRQAVEGAKDRIEAKLAEANRALQEACKISNETGVPFESPVSSISQAYVPRSFHEKFDRLITEKAGYKDDFFYSLIGMGEYTLEDNYDGWEHSAVC